MEIAIGIVAGVLVFLVSYAMVRLIGRGPGPSADPDDVVEADVGYGCVVCGMRITVTHHAEGGMEPPRHCHEAMERLDGARGADP